MEQVAVAGCAEKRNTRRMVILSECCGEIPTTMINDSAVIILFATMMGLGDTFSMITSSLSGLANCLLLIPCAYLADRIGYKRSIRVSSATGMAMFLLLGLSPFLGIFSKPAALIAPVIYGLAIPVYVSAFYPLMDRFLLAEERAKFVGLNRFCWMTVSFLYIFSCGWFMGHAPSLFVLQIILLTTCVLGFGRFVFIGRVPCADEKAPNADNFKKAFRLAVTNTPLCGFAVYLFCLYLASYTIAPLTFLYLKKHVGAGDNVVVMISAVMMIGTLSGYLCSGHFLSRLGAKRTLLGIHFGYALIAFSLFLCFKTVPYVTVVIACLLVVYGFLTASASVVVASEMMRLARKNNKAMAMALCCTFFNAGMGLSRFFSSIALGSGIFAAFWTFFGWQVSHYQTIFLISSIAVLLATLMLVLVPALIPQEVEKA